MWLIALLGSSTAFVEATLAQLYKEKRPSLRGIPGRSGLLYPPFFQRRIKRETGIPACLSFRIVRSGLLVRDQPGDRKFRFFCFWRTPFSDTAAFYNNPVGGAGGGDRSAEERHDPGLDVMECR